MREHESHILKRQLFRYHPYRSLPPFLHRTHHAGQGVVDDKIDQCRHSKQYKYIGYIHITSTIVTAGCGQQLLRPRHQFDGCHVCQVGRILDGRDHLAEEGRDDVPVCLGQDDIDHDLHHVEALRMTGFKLPVGDGVQSSTDDLGNDGRGKQDQSNRCLEQQLRLYRGQSEQLPVEQLRAGAEHQADEDPQQ